jgi:membrane-associated HD superfamily phosphohydrolase
MERGLWVAVAHAPLWATVIEVQKEIIEAQVVAPEETKTQTEQEPIGAGWENNDTDVNGTVPLQEPAAETDTTPEPQPEPTDPEPDQEPSAKTLAEIAHDEHKELMRKEREAELQRQIQEAELGAMLTEDEKQKAVEEGAEEIKEIIDKSWDENDTEKILRDIAQYYYDKEAELIQEAWRLSAENKVLLRELDKVRDEYNTLKYSTNKVTVNDEMRMLVNMYERYQTNQQDERNNTRLLKYLFGLASTIDPDFDPEEAIDAVKQRRISAIQALSWVWMNSTPAVKPEQPQRPKMTWVPVARVVQPY